MSKIVINGEHFEYDGSKNPMSEALEIERVLDIRYVQWEAELQAGSMKALAAFAWRVWHRNGRDVSLEDVVAGKVDIEAFELLESLATAGRELEAAQAEQESPKEVASPSTGSAKAGSATTGSSTSESSPSG